MPEVPSEAGVAGEKGVMGPPGLGVAGLYKLALDGGRTGLKPMPGESNGLCKQRETNV